MYKFDPNLRPPETHSIWKSTSSIPTSGHQKLILYGNLQVRSQPPATRNSFYMEIYKFDPNLRPPETHSIWKSTKSDHFSWFRYHRISGTWSVVLFARDASKMKFCQAFKHSVHPCIRLFLFVHYQGRNSRATLTYKTKLVQPSL